MADYFLDSSAVVKHYVSESGSDWVTALLRPAAKNTIHIAEFTGAETLSGFVRRMRRGELTEESYSDAVGQFRREYDTLFVTIEVRRPTVLRAMNLVERHGLRGYDAIQLATALGANDELLTDELPPLTFVSADGNLCNAAAGEGLPVENPDNHP